MSTQFALFIEPLVQKIREDQEIRLILIKETGFKACVHTDNILITLSQPDLSLPKLMSCLATF